LRAEPYTAGFGLDLPGYPWDSLTPYRETAQRHPGGVCDLSIGTPVDPTPAVIREALAAAADWPGYPTTQGTPELREAIAAFCREVFGAQLDPAREVLPLVGSKEAVAWLPTLLGLRQRGLAVAHPAAAYPTYAMGAEIAGVPARVVDADEILSGADLSGVGLLWVNSPGNPTGRVLTARELARIVEAARAAGVVVASDECYATLGWEGAEVAPSILDPAVTGGDHTGLLSVYSLSKQSNLAGYRAAYLAGDPVLVENLLTARKHAGMIMPGPVQEAMIAALGDAAHRSAQKELYRARRAVLRPAVEAFGLRIDHSEAGLYLWGTRGEDCWETIGALAELGIIAGPGAFYGEAGARHVRIALTASDAVIAGAASRLRGA
jgi:succinyldiaminopimelate transaminase